MNVLLQNGWMSQYQKIVARVHSKSVNFWHAEQQHSWRTLRSICRAIQFSYLLINKTITLKRRKEKKLISPNPRGGRRISSSAYLRRHPFGYYLPCLPSYGTIFVAQWSSHGRLEAVVSKWLAQGHKGLTAHRCFLSFFCFCFSPPNALLFVLDHTTKLRIKELLKAQQWWVERDSNLIPSQYRSNALTTTPCSLQNNLV